MFMDIDFNEQPSDLAATGVARAGAKFKPKARPRLRKHVSVSTSGTLSIDANEKLSIQSENLSNALFSEIHVPDHDDTVNQSTHGTMLEENVHVLSGGVHCCIEPTDLHTRTDVDSEKQRCDEKDMFLDDPKTQDLETLGVFVSPEIDEDIHAQTKSIQPEEEEEDRFDLESLQIVQEGTNACDLLKEKFPQVPEEMVPEIGTGNSPRGWEQVESPSNNTVVREDSCFENTEEEQSGRERNVRKSKRATSEKSKPALKRKQSKEPNQCNKKPQQKNKFKHSTPRQKRTLEKELLEVPDDEIRFLAIRDLLRLVDYKEWLEKKEAKGRKGSQIQESSSIAYENQYSQDDAYNFDSEEDRENQETSRVKPDSPVNYQTFLHKTARSRWSKQDTELFYEGIGEFGSNLSMVQQLFPERSRQQLKLKYKLEERKHPLKLNDTLTSRSKDQIHYHNVIKKLQQEVAARKAEEEEAETAGEDATEAVEPETNDIPDNAEQAADDEEAEKGMRSDGAKAENDQRSNGDDDDETECDYWASYKSDM